MVNKKKILYIGPYREFSGAGNSARKYIEALHRGGHDICISPIFYTGEIYPENDISSDILPLESNYLNSYDIIIQHCHPFDFNYDHNFSKNIGIFQFNSCQLSPSLGSRLNLMDEIIVNSEFNEHVIKKSRLDINKKIKIVPELIDTNIIYQKYNEYEWIDKKSCVFYTIGDMTNRKNIEKIILAFLYSFNQRDSVELVIKTKPHFSHRDANIVYKEIEYILSKCYRILRKNKEELKQPKIMVGAFQEHHLNSIHYNCNCYIDASKAENFGYSVLEAATFGNYIITNKNSSTSGISNKTISTQSQKINIIDPDTPSFVYNRLEDYWYDIDIIELSNNMKKVALKYQCDQEISHEISQYDYSNIEKLLI